MATKSKIEVGDRSNRVRFVMLEADLSDSNFGALANAIVSALRPDAPAPKRLPSPAGPAPLGRIASVAPNGQDGHEQSVQPDIVRNEETEEATADEVSVTGTTSSPTRTRKPSKPTQPKYLPDLFASAAEADAFKAFLAQHPTKKDSERYLVSAIYLRDNGSPVVNLDTMYTCYRTAGDWPMTITDWDVNLRNQVRNDRFRRTDGGYSVTTAGEAVVQGLRTKTT